MTKLSTHQTEYQITLRKTLVAELGFLLEVAQGRLPDRKTIQDQLKEGALSIVTNLAGNSNVPLLDTVVGTAGNYLLDKMKERENEWPALLQSLLRLSHRQLESMADRVAREAACRWDMAINAYLEEEAIQEFAVIGAMRIVEYLRRKALSITTENLLLGLTAGSSGAGYLQYTNTQLPLKASMSGTIRKATLSAEGLYGRVGYLIGKDFYIPDIVLDEEGYKAYRLMNRPKEEGHFGYVKYLKIGSSGGTLDGKWPKAGYVQLPEKQLLNPIANKEQDGYEFVPHQAPWLMQTLRKERATRFITEKEIHEYLEHISRLDTNIPSLNEYFKAMVFFRGSLTGTRERALDLSRANFNGSDFSGCTLERCLLGNCQGLYLTEATLRQVSATGNQLDGAHLDRATVTDSKFTKLTGLQTDWSYATIQRSDFKDVVGHGMILDHATIDEATKKTFDSDLGDRLVALAKQQEEEHKKLTEEIKRNLALIGVQARQLQILASQQQDIKIAVESNTKPAPEQPPFVSVVSANPSVKVLIPQVSPGNVVSISDTAAASTVIYPSNFDFLVSQLNPIRAQEQRGLVILNQYQRGLADSKVNAENLNTFLRLVAEGEQDNAEKLLESNLALALASGDVTDLAGRSFKNITAFQYAVWALDWHMWTMIRKYIPNEKAKEQLQGMEKGSWVKQHGVSASWQNLLDALQKFIDLCNIPQWTEAGTQWTKQVGGAQRLLPTHVVNEYCYPDRPFDPCPDFTKDTLPRSCNTDEGDWYKATYSNGKLGETFAYLRYSLNSCTAATAGDPWTAESARRVRAIDLKACHTLLDIRAQQRDQLFAELSVHVQAQPIAASAASPASTQIPPATASTSSSTAATLTAQPVQSTIATASATYASVVSPATQQPPIPIRPAILASSAAANTTPSATSPASPAPVAVAHQFQNQRALADIKVTAETLNTFLKLVADGEQDSAEALLKSNRELALASGDVTDLAGRSFKNITAFQYAVWALDWHMWTMIRKYIPTEKAKEQLRGMEKGSWVKQHDVSASWQNLLDALQKYIDLSRERKWDEVDAQWIKKVGGAQRLLPTHVVNEYCHPDKPFKPCPDFTKGSLTRSRNTGEEEEWYTATYQSGKLGESFAYYRHSDDLAYRASLSAPRAMRVAWGAADLKACHTLLDTRAQQRDQLFAELSVHVQAQRKAVR